MGRRERPLIERGETLDITPKIEVKIEKADDLVEAARDTFSPASEFLGLLGDSVRLARMHVAAEVTRKAKRIADENGLALSAPPLKFLVPFYEKASLEEESDSDAQLRWVNLLVDASTSEVHPYFVSLLSEIEGSQAKLLRKVFFDESIAKKVPAELDKFDGVARDCTQLDVQNCLEPVLTDNQIALDKLEELFDVLRFHFSGQGVTIGDVSITFTEGESGHAETNRNNFRDISELDNIDFDILASLNLVERNRFIHKLNVDLAGNQFPSWLEVNVFQITSLGTRFVMAFDRQANEAIKKRKASTGHSPERDEKAD